MTKTAAQTVDQAHRELGVLSVDEAASADMTSYGTTVLEGLLDTAETQQGLSLDFDSGTVPDGVWLPLSQLLAAHLAAHYGRPYMSQAQAWGRFRAAVTSDDRADDGRDYTDVWGDYSNQGEFY